MLQYEEELNREDVLLKKLLSKARTLQRPHHVFLNPLELEREIRRKRKLCMGSSLSITSVIFCKSEDGLKMDESALNVLVDFLSSRTVYFWDKPRSEGLRFCRQFFELSIPAVADPSVAGESFDDLILLSNTLVRSKPIFWDVMTHLFEDRADYDDQLRSFTYDYDEEYYNANFESSVLAAVAVFLGVLRDPFGEEDIND